jgi:hypothetical protein
MPALTTKLLLPVLTLAFVCRCRCGCVCGCECWISKCVCTSLLASAVSPRVFMHPVCSCMTDCVVCGALLCPPWLMMQVGAKTEPSSSLPLSSRPRSAWHPKRGAPVLSPESPDFPATFGGGDVEAALPLAAALARVWVPVACTRPSAAAVGRGGGGGGGAGDGSRGVSSEHGWATVWDAVAAWSGPTLIEWHAALCVYRRGGFLVH